MANTDTLTSLLDDVGDAIREKTGKTAKMAISEMPAEIAGIETGVSIPLRIMGRPIFDSVGVAGLTYGSGKTVSDVISMLDSTGCTSLSMLFKGIGVGAFYGDNPSFPDISGWNTSAVTNMSNAFNTFGYGIHYSAANYQKIFAPLNLNGWDTSNVTDMSGMFSNVTAQTIDISSFDTSKVTTMREFFYGSTVSGASTIGTLITGAGFVHSQITGATNKPKFHFACTDENGASFAANDVIPEGAHEYTFNYAYKRA